MNASMSVDEVRLRYQRFAEYEAAGVSPLYFSFAVGVSETPRVLRWLASMPIEKQQPNLLFAATRHVCGTPHSSEEFLELVGDHAESIA